MDGNKLLAVRRYIVTEVIERLSVSEISHYQTLTKTVFDRKCAPIGDLIVFHEEGNQLLESLVDGEPNSSENVKPDITKLDDMSTANLQSVMKDLSGGGFPIGTTKKKMIKSIRKHQSVTKDQE